MNRNEGMGNDKKKTGHWAEVLFELSDEPLFDAAAEEDAEKPAEKPAQTAPEPVDWRAEPKSDEPKESEPKSGEKPVKKRTVAKKSEKKGEKKTAKKSVRARKTIELLDSPEQIKLDLTVGALDQAQSVGKRKKRVKSTVSEVDLIEKAEEAERVKATETVRTMIAAQLGELVQEKAVEPAQKAEEPENSGRTTDHAGESAGFDSLFDDFEEETLEISWGRPPRATKKETFSEPSAAAEAAVLSDFEKEDADGGAACDNGSDGVQEDKNKGKISKEAAEELFAARFDRSQTDRQSAKKEPPAESESDFWGIPDEPEILFVSRPSKKSAFCLETKAPEPKPERPRTEPKRSELAVAQSKLAQNVSERTDRRLRSDDQPERAERSERSNERHRGARRAITPELAFDEPVVSESVQRAEAPTSDSPLGAQDRPAFRRGRRERDVRPNEEWPDRPERIERSERPERTGRAERPVPSGDDAQRSFPSWQEAISQVIRFNMDRHTQRSKDHAPRRKGGAQNRF